MQERSPRPVRTFTLAFDERDHDEAPHARAIAAHLGTEHAEVRVAPGSLPELVLELPEFFDEPLADPCQIPALLLARLSRGSLTVALSGAGGDEVFAGYTRYLLAERLARGLGRLPRWARASAAPHPGGPVRGDRRRLRAAAAPARPAAGRRPRAQAGRPARLPHARRPLRAAGQPLEPAARRGAGDRVRGPRPRRGGRAVPPAHAAPGRAHLPARLGPGEQDRTAWRPAWRPASRCSTTGSSSSAGACRTGSCGGTAGGSGCCGACSSATCRGPCSTARSAASSRRSGSGWGPLWESGRGPAERAAPRRGRAGRRRGGPRAARRAPRGAAQLAVPAVGRADAPGVAGAVDVRGVVAPRTGRRTGRRGCCTCPAGSGRRPGARDRPPGPPGAQRGAGPPHPALRHPPGASEPRPRRRPDALPAPPARLRRALPLAGRRVQRGSASTSSTRTTTRRSSTGRSRAAWPGVAACRHVPHLPGARRGGRPVRDAARRGARPRGRRCGRRARRAPRADGVGPPLRDGLERRRPGGVPAGRARIGLARAPGDSRDHASSPWSRGCTR